MRWITSVLLLAAFAAPVATFADAAEPACDRSAIHWVLPGHFDDAVARAKEEKRILIIKGVSFGIDAEGAKCATKGHW